MITENKPCNFDAPNSPSKDEKLEQLISSFSNHAQDISQEIAPRVSSCLALDTRFQELTRQAISDCSVEPGSFVEPTQDPDFSDIVQELHQNLDEKIVFAKNMLIFLRSRSHEMNRKLQTFQKSSESSSNNSNAQVVDPENPQNGVISKNGRKANSSESKRFKNLKKKILASQKQRQPVANSRVLKNKLLRLKKQKSSSSGSSSKVVENATIVENEESVSKDREPVNRKRVNINKKNVKRSKSYLQHRKAMKQPESGEKTVEGRKEETNSNESVKESDEDSKMEVDNMKSSASSANNSNPALADMEEKQDSNSNMDLTDSQSQSSPSQYCVCNEPFNGDMIACDGESCKVEWFHFRCVGMKAAPKGRWFCDECSKLRNIRQTPKRLAKKFNPY